jgi:hypothetical protein
MVKQAFGLPVSLAFHFILGVIIHSVLDRTTWDRMGWAGLSIGWDWVGCLPLRCLALQDFFHSRLQLEATRSSGVSFHFMGFLPIPQRRRTQRRK